MISQNTPGPYLATQEETTLCAIAQRQLTRLRQVLTGVESIDQIVESSTEGLSGLVGKVYHGLLCEQVRKTLPHLAHSKELEHDSAKDRNEVFASPTEIENLRNHILNEAQLIKSMGNHGRLLASLVAQLVAFRAEIFRMHYLNILVVKANSMAKTKTSTNVASFKTPPPAMSVSAPSGSVSSVETDTNEAATG
jgi:hypothetical protein